MSRKQTLIAVVLLLGLWFMASYVPQPREEPVSLATVTTADAKLWSITTELEDDGSFREHYVVAQTFTQAYDLVLEGHPDEQMVSYGNVAIPIAVECGHGVTYRTKVEE